MPDSGNPPVPVAKQRKKSAASKLHGKQGAGDKKDEKKESAFRVAVRCRPLLPHERMQQPILTLTKSAVTVAQPDDVDSLDSPRMPSPRRERPGQATSFAFDHVYDEFVTQAEVYEQFVAPFTAQFLAG